MRKLLLGIALMAMMSTGVAGSDGLGSLQGRYRVLVVFTPTDTAGDEIQQMLSDSAGIAGHDIAWFVISPEGSASNMGLRIDRNEVADLHEAAGFDAVLLGKDGRIKLRQTEALNLPALFDALDRMPRRRRERQSLP